MRNRLRVTILGAVLALIAVFAVASQASAVTTTTTRFDAQTSAGHFKYDLTWHKSGGGIIYLDKLVMVVPAGVATTYRAGIDSYQYIGDNQFGWSTQLCLNGSNNTDSCDERGAGTWIYDPADGTDPMGNVQNDNGQCGLTGLSVRLHAERTGPGTNEAFDYHCLGTIAP